MPAAIAAMVCRGGECGKTSHGTFLISIALYECFGCQNSFLQRRLMLSHNLSLPRTLFCSEKTFRLALLGEVDAIIVKNTVSGGLICLLLATRGSWLREILLWRPSSCVHALWSQLLVPGAPQASWYREASCLYPSLPWWKGFASDLS